MWTTLRIVDFSMKTQFFLLTFGIEDPVSENDENLSPKNQPFFNIELTGSFQHFNIKFLKN